MTYNPSEIKEKAARDFEKTWLETYNSVERKGRNIYLKKGNQGKFHVIPDLIQQFRQLFLSYGFNEVLNDPFVAEDEIRRQYGPEAYVIADRVFYIAGLPRPDIGISKEKIDKINKIKPGFTDIKKLMETLRLYRKGEIDGDNFVEEMVNRVNLKPEEVTKIMDSVFPEFKKLEPIATRLTLRSHMTANWFSVLSKLQYKLELPIKLFSVDRVFRREQKVDEKHLRSYHSASIVIMNDKISEEDILAISEQLLGELDFLKIKIVKKKVPSKYYIPGTEYEVYAQSKNVSSLGNKDWMEIANFGLYNPISLANYDIVYPVFNLGIGIERVAMLLTGENDIRKILYPYLYEEHILSDSEIAKAISFIDFPKTERGKKIKDLVLRKVLDIKDDIGPKKILAYSDEKVRIFVTEPESGKRVLGPAGLNAVYVYNSEIMGIDPFKPEFEKVIRNGTYVTSYLDAIANKVAAMAEREEKGKYSVKMVKSLHSINLKLAEKERRYLEGKGKRIDIRGPVFLDFEIE